MRKAPLALCFLMLSACSTLRAFKSPSESYHKYVDRRLKVERIFDRGREMLIAKVLPVTPTLMEEQEKLTPVRAVRYKPEQRQLVMALNVTGREAMFLNSWELRLGGRKAQSFEEVRDDEVIENEFYFGYPFYRVFVVNFPPPAAPADDSVEVLDVLSPYGRISMKCDFESVPAVATVPAPSGPVSTPEKGAQP